MNQRGAATALRLEVTVFDDRRPIYRQIAERIRAEVLSGTLTGDEQVMSTTQYASFYRINPATAAKAFAELVDEGVLYKRRGVGMFVSPHARAHLRNEHRGRFFAEVVDPMVAEAEAIGVPLTAVIEHIEAQSAARPATDGPGAEEPGTGEPGTGERGTGERGIDEKGQR